MKKRASNRRVSKRRQKSIREDRMPQVVAVIISPSQDVPPKPVALLTKIQDQAVKVLLILKEQGGYLPLQRLKSELAKNKVEFSNLPLIAAFLLGYLESQVFESPFNVQVFGPNSFAMFEGKEEPVKTALHAILHLQETN